MSGNKRPQHIAALLALVVWGLAGCTSSTGGDATLPPTSSPETYRIASQADYDAAKQRVYDGGDQILFARGQTFDGPIRLRRSNIRPDRIIRVADYGSATDPRPLIRADADGMGVIDIRDSGGWTIENLELVNESATRSERMGIYVTATDSGFHEDFVVRNCLVHDVTGEPGNKDNGGIIFRVWGDSVPTKFDNILLEDNEIHDISGVGIRIKSPWEADPSDPRQGSREIGRYAFQNVVVRGNRVRDITKNAIIVGSADAPLVEFNVMGPNISTEFTGNSFFNFATDDAVIQYNEAFGNTGPADDHDRGGFDADWNARNTVFRYNYSHDNNYAFAIMRRYHDGLRIHHNISENERYGFIMYGFPNENRVTNLEVSNNTFYSIYPGMQMFLNAGRVREPVNTTFVDNIFVFAAGDGTWGSEPTVELGNVFENNLVFGMDEPDYQVPADDPLLVAPGTTGAGVDMNDPDRFAGYRLCEGSPALGAGRDGNIGEYQGDGIDCSTTAGNRLPMNVFVLAGQSNMSGRGAVEEIDRTPHPRIHTLNADDEWVIAVEPLHHDKPRIAGVGPGFAFAKAVADKNPDVRVGLVPTAVGGSPIQTWTPGAIHESTGLHPWDDAVRRLQLARQAGELKAILWHQGEGDSGAGRAPHYEERLHDLIRRFRAAAGDDNLPFIVGQLGQFKEWSEGRHIVNKAHVSVPDKIPNTRFVSSDGLTDKDGTHFDAASARELGRRYAEAYADIQQSTTQ